MWFFLSRFLLLLSAVHGVGASLSPLEESFCQVPDARSARRNLRYITSKPHVAGTPGDDEMGAFVSKQFEKAGIPNVTTFSLTVSLNTPKSPPHVWVVSQQNHSQVVHKATLSEDILTMDDTSDTYWRNHTFHGYSPSGNLVAPLVYANYGRPQDFALLQKHNVSVQDCLVLVRYGRCFRGLKVMNAQQRGARGVVIYSDPADDGYGQGPTYPDGPWRPAFGVQRGSVQFNSKCAGDPRRADPRYDKNRTYKEVCGVSNVEELIPSIPSVPMSYGDALVLLQQLGGPVVSEDFVGGLNVDYRVGPSRGTVVKLVVDNQDQIRSIPNVVGVIPGTLPPSQDMPVLLGNHRDAWVFGAADPNSGTASLIEVANGLGALVRKGWKPARSIYLLSWSGEEYGLLGSTGWAELNADLIPRAAAYLNVDTAVSGDLLSVSTTPSLATLWNRVLDDLQEQTTTAPFANGPVGQVLDANTNWVMNHPQEKMLGSGSDYTVFLDHLGIPSLDFAFGKNTTYGQYHSIYDSFSWMDAYGGRDGETGSAFELMVLVSQIWGLLCLRLADATLLPMDQVVQAEALSHYTDSIASHGLDLSALVDAVSNYRQAASDLHEGCASGEFDASVCNEKLGLVERQFLDPRGLPERPWFKHVLQAPGMYLGYAAEAFPGVQQAIEAGDLELAEQQVQVAAARVQAAASFLFIPCGSVSETTS